MRSELDPGQLGLTVLSLFKLKEGEVASAVLHVGHKLGLFTALDEAGTTTSVASAEATGLHERWVREFLFLLSSLDLAQHDDGEFMLTPEASVVLAQPDHPWFGSAAELTALALMKQGENERAGQLFAQIAAAENVPDTLKLRATQLAGVLGIDAVPDEPIEMEISDITAPAGTPGQQEEAE